MSRKAVDRAVRETYALHYVLMGLGILPEEIFVGAPFVANAVPPGTYAFVKVVRGSSEFGVWLEPLEGKDCERFIRAWSEFSHAQPKMARSELDAIVQASKIVWQAEEITVGLFETGFDIGPKGSSSLAN